MFTTLSLRRTVTKPISFPSPPSAPAAPVSSSASGPASTPAPAPAYTTYAFASAASPSSSSSSSSPISSSFSKMDSSLATQRPLSTQRFMQSLASLGPISPSTFCSLATSWLSKASRSASGKLSSTSIGSSPPGPKGAAPLSMASWRAARAFSLSISFRFSTERFWMRCVKSATALRKPSRCPFSPRRTKKGRITSRGSRFMEVPSSCMCESICDCLHTSFMRVFLPFISSSRHDSSM
mmetsp:Transcript_4974/g.10866  ORF Transcript_4974/g.10866 Transcript_4974/m.10866 type:complete len:238 (-) Transcript_4974:946-1659(-)